MGLYSGGWERSLSTVEAMAPTVGLTQRETMKPPTTLGTEVGLRDWKGCLLCH